MAMTDKEQLELRAYCAYILKEYGFDIPINDPLIPALYLIHKQLQANSESNRNVASKLIEAAAKSTPKVFNFTNEDAALKFQVGIGIKYVLIGFVISVLVLIAIWCQGMMSDIKRANIIISTTGSVGELVKRVKKDSKGFLIIDFSAAKGDSIQRFKEFQKIDANTVRVYIGKESR